METVVKVANQHTFESLGQVVDFTGRKGIGKFDETNWNNVLAGKVERLFVDLPSKDKKKEPIRAWLSPSISLDMVERKIAVGEMMTFELSKASNDGYYIRRPEGAKIEFDLATIDIRKVEVKEDLNPEDYMEL